MKVVMVLNKIPDGMDVSKFDPTVTFSDKEGKWFCTYVYKGLKMKPLPKEFGIDIEDDYAKGWNDCLKEITE